MNTAPTTLRKLNAVMQLAIMKETCASPRDSKVRGNRRRQSFEVQGFDGSRFKVTITQTQKATR